ncbi:hypothetical protein KSS87_009779 [Heliosperma pusillum]|nr:hypothetical protein KSS87_009779 [Heliosperma pusillum]
MIMTTSVQPSNLLASIDMGSNSFKLLIIQFEPSTSKFTTLHHHSSAVVLGLTSTPPFISPESKSRAIQALSEFQSILRYLDISQTRVVGTSALREAANQGDFIQEVREKLGFDFNVGVISGVEEARLTYLGVLQLLPVYNRKVLILDIGGGSTEFVIGKYGNVVFAESLRLGYVTLTQKFREGDLIGLIRGYVYEQIQASGLIGEVKDLGYEVAIGSSGTIRAIEKAIWCGYECDERGVRKGDRRRKWWWFSREELRGFVDNLCRGFDNQGERVKRDVFFGKRSEFIVAGAVLLDVILELLDISEMRVSGYALGEGVVAEMVSKSFPGCDLNANVRWKSVIRLAMRFNGKDRMKSSARCAATSKEIFEGLKEYDNVTEIHSTGVSLQEEDLEYLQAACMLHNIGLYYGKDGYHKQTCSIIMENGQLDGYTTQEIQILQLISQLARHHRKKFPSFDCASLQGLSRQVKLKFGILCSILRISVIIQKDKALKHRELKFSHAHEGFVLALIEKEERQLHPDLQNSAHSVLPVCCFRIHPTQEAAIFIATSKSHQLLFDIKGLIHDHPSYHRVFRNSPSTPHNSVRVSLLDDTISILKLELSKMGENDRSIIRRFWLWPRKDVWSHAQNSNIWVLPGKSLKKFHEIIY